MSKTQQDYSQVPSYTEAADRANLPTKVKVEELVGRQIVIKSWEPATAVLPDTGKETEGFEVYSYDEADDQDQIWFCGQVVLKRELAALAPPFRTVIKKEGRTYRFS